MTLWLVVALVLIMVIGPVLYLVPSPRERQVTRLRQRAMNHGVLVKLTQLPHPEPTPEMRVSPGGEVRTPTLETVAYRLPVRARDNEDRAPVFRLDRVQGESSPDLAPGWRWGEAPRKPDPAFLQAVLAVLPRLPDSTHALEVAPDAVAVMWRERGDEARVDALLAELQTLADLVAELRNRPPEQLPPD